MMDRSRASDWFEMSLMPGNQRGRDRGGGFYGNSPSSGGRGRDGGRGGRGRDGGRGGRGRDGGRGGRRGGDSFSSRPDLHQANQSFYRGSSSWNSCQASSSSQPAIERRFDQLSIKGEKELIRFPSRPPPGTIGKAFWVKTNHFLVEIESFLKEICHYNVTITPEVTSSRLNRAVMKELVKLYEQSVLGNLLLAYDGQKSIYTVGRLPFTSKEFTVTLPNGTGLKNKDFVVAICLVAVIDLHDLRLFLNGKDIELPQAVIQALDVVLRQMANSQYDSGKRSFFSRIFGTMRIGAGLEAWRGFFQSVRPTQMGLTLNIDILAAVYVEQIDLIEFVKQILWGRDISTGPLSDAERRKIKSALKGLKIETHRGKIGQKFSKSDLTSEPTTELTFPFGENGDSKHVVQYFWETYNMVLKYPSLPCLKVGNGGTIYLPMEVCRIVGGQRHTKGLNKSQTANFLKMNSQRPADRENSIMRILSQNNYGNDEYCNKFGIKISESLSAVEARKLPPPRLRYSDSGKEKMCQPKGGQWNMMNKKMFEGGTVNSWVCINFERSVSYSLASQFCSAVATICNDYGMTCNLNPILPPRRAHPEQVEIALESLYEDAMARLKSPCNTLDMLIAILPENNGSLYGELKRICDTKLGIISQCFLDKTVGKMDPRSLTMAAEKINVKAGGRNVVLEDALMQCIPLVSDRPTIIFGADVTHPRPGNDSSPSIAAVVASLDWRLLANYAPEVSAQAARQERIEDMYRMSKAHFLSFHKENNQKPERIIVFRDGISEGQFNDVVQYELKAIQQAWIDTFNASDPPPITFVVVQKRHHTRFFPTNQKDPELADKSGNILPGTVVDTGVCHPGERDFYLNSHAGIQGTNRPAHYHVVWDDNHFSEDQIQTLCNNLCYTYERCTRAVSYATPAYYAHLLAFRARHYLGIDSPSDGSTDAGCPVMKELPRFCDNLKNRMFYI